MILTSYLKDNKDFHVNNYNSIEQYLWPDLSESHNTDSKRNQSGKETVSRSNNIEGIRLFPKNISSMVSSYLYVTDNYDRQKFLKVKDDISVICFCRRDIEKPDHNNIIVIQSEKDFADDFNFIEQIYNRFTDWIKTLNFSVFHDSSFQELLDVSSEILPCPILIYDPALKLLAYSGVQYAKDDKLFLKAIKNGYMDLETVHYFEQTEAFKQISETGQTFGEADAYREHSDSIKAINIDNELAIYCVLLHTDEYNKSYHGQLFDILCESFADLLKKQHSTFKKDRSATDYFLMDLLDNPDMPDIQIRERLAYNDLDYYGDYAVITIHSDIRTKSSEEVFIAYLRNNMINCRIFSYKDSIVILFILPASAIISYRNFLEEKLSNVFTEYPSIGINFSVSKPFSSLADFSSAYKQADNAYHMSEDIYPPQNMIFFEELQIMDLIKQNPVKNKQFFYCDSCIIDLINQNSSKSRQQLDILREYLQNDRSFRIASEKLFMHHNNVVYHIRRLEEKYDLDLSDYRTRLKLLISFEILSSKSF